MSDYDDDADQMPVVAKKGPVAPPSDEEAAGKSSVMPETMEMAANAASSVQRAAEVVGDVTASAVTHEVRSRVLKASTTQEAANAATPEASAAVLAAAASKHRASVSAAGAVGKQAGAAVGQGAGAVILQVARRLGAHRCDNCGKANLYNYWACSNAGCQADAEGRLAGYDLCYDCHAKFLASRGVNACHNPAHQFEEHKNGVYAFKLLGAGLLALMVTRWLISKILF